MLDGPKHARTVLQDARRDQQRMRPFVHHPSFCFYLSLLVAERGWRVADMRDDTTQGHDDITFPTARMADIVGPPYASP